MCQNEEGFHVDKNSEQKMKNWGGMKMSILSKIDKHKKMFGSPPPTINTLHYGQITSNTRAQG